MLGIKETWNQRQKPNKVDRRRTEMILKVSSVPEELTHLRAAMRSTSLPTSFPRQTLLPMEAYVHGFKCWDLSSYGSLLGTLF